VRQRCPRQGDVDTTAGAGQLQGDGQARHQTGPMRQREASAIRAAMDGMMGRNGDEDHQQSPN